MFDGVRFATQEIRTYFVTSVTANRRRLFQVSANANLMLEVLQHYRKQNQFALHAFVIMPDHLHLLITPVFNVSLEKSFQYIKGGFSFRLKSKLEVWERGFNEAQIRCAEKFEGCRRYIEENPVLAGLSASPEGYAFSSARADQDVDPIPRHFLRPH